ncbi:MULTISPECIES: hypothetical protein [unclassified Nostoc]|uniref:hypothetical protein n=1 Tax=unclassified Nostoc TaxID=2593658 RepID=UPI002FFBBC26
METTTKKAALLKAIYERIEQVSEDTLEDVLEILDIRQSEEKDIKDTLAELKDAKVNGKVSWEQYKQELKSELYPNSFRFYANTKTPLTFRKWSN